jgi:hypothetical protein
MKTILGSAALLLLLGMNAANAATVCDVGSNAAVACSSVGTTPKAAIYQDPANNFNGGHTEYSIHTIAAGEITNNTGNVLGFTLPAAQGGSTVTAHFNTDDAVNASNGNAQIGVGTDTFNSMDVFFTANNTQNSRLGFQDFRWDTLFSRNNNLDDISITAFLNNNAIVSFAANTLGGGEIGWFALGFGSQVFDLIRVTSLGGGMTVGGFQKSDHFEVSGLTTLGGTPTPNIVPLPAGLWLFGTAIAGLGAFKAKARSRARRNTNLTTA